jgi:hypothetical protein
MVFQVIKARDDLVLAEKLCWTFLPHFYPFWPFSNES